MTGRLKRVAPHGADMSDLAAREILVARSRALTHEQPNDPVMRPILLAGADLAAVAIERHRAA